MLYLNPGVMRYADYNVEFWKCTLLLAGRPLRFHPSCYYNLPSSHLAQQKHRKCASKMSRVARGSTTNKKYARKIPRTIWNGRQVTVQLAPGKHWEEMKVLYARMRLIWFLSKVGFICWILWVIKSTFVYDSFYQKYEEKAAKTFDNKQ